MKATIYHVAEEAGVSTATVSKVINNKGLISMDTKRRVLEATRKLNYHPNEMAKALIGKKTKVIGLLVSDIASPFFAELTRSISEQCRFQGFSIMVCSTDGQPDKEKSCVSALIRQDVDGFIVASDHYPEIIEDELKKRGLKGVFLSTEPEKQDYVMPLITIDNYEGACQAVRHLLASNHKKIAMIAENTAAGKVRLRAFHDTMEEAQLPLDKQFVVKTASSIENGYECAKRLLALKERPSAIFVSCDVLSGGVIKAAREMNVRIPQELSIIGFDNLSICELTSPPLTTIAQPIRIMGRRAVELLIKQIDGAETYMRTHIVETSLMVRNSTSFHHDI
ncbi:LacI family transcriptional regulator [Domibacillus indicus]|uniref:LacI family DNA-binding transcriptional regulator n=1 Tax=Domibacillus indicus TaxID=1437523 RepID=UPI0020416C91|nr:LacI family DNA-binding transcriptional regulator [Domibacillus indicus]MCM3791336.1 LacI family transcriptional regulator [Domibacillus indicus]